MFYSINSPIVGLGGLELASYLIKEVASRLSTDFPSLTTFSTLSPIPQFMSWLGKLSSRNIDDSLDIHISDHWRNRFKDIYNDMDVELSVKYPPPIDFPSIQMSTVVRWLHNILLSDPFLLDAKGLAVDGDNERRIGQLRDLIREIACSFCAYYLSFEKKETSKDISVSRWFDFFIFKEFGLLQSEGKQQPLDPVARFHLRNGASLHSVNWMGNTSSEGQFSLSSHTDFLT